MPSSDPLSTATRTLTAAAEAMPTAEEVDQLRTDLVPALERGYFTPEEDLRIRRMFARYLHVRDALHRTLQSLRPLVPRFFRRRDDETALRAFVAAWLSGCMLMRSARYILTEFYELAPTYRILNQADLSHNIPAGMLDRIHRSATRPATLLRYFRAARFEESHRTELAAFEDDPVTGPLLNQLKQEHSFLELQKRVHATEYARCRIDRIRRSPRRRLDKAVWGLFEASGRAIAEMRNPFHRKRVRRRVRVRAGDALQPGDVLVTRHDDALSNLFLPGFWPHAALVIGTEEQRARLDIHLPDTKQERARDPVFLIEAKKDGVLFRTLKETLAVDSFVCLRPRVDDAARREVVERALSHEGKLYDFEFDFTRSDRLVCTEVVYRSMDGIGPLRFELIRKAGRHTLPAEELLRQALKSDHFDIPFLYGVGGNRFVEGERAVELLKRSLGARDESRTP